MTELAARALDGIGLLDSLTVEERDALGRTCRWRRYASGEQIIDRSSDSRDVFFVIGGAVRVVIYSLSGREIALDDITAGGVFGELAALDGSPRSASVMAIGETTVASMTADQFLRVLREHPDVALALMRRLATVIRVSGARILDLSTLGANNRVHADLLALCRTAEVTPEGHARIRPIPVHSDIAARVSTTRETVARVLNDLSRQGIVRRDADALVVLDVERLRDLVEEVRGE
ncbi:MAG: Crp/Fnr family transcriptional regulator [Caenispirillum bisanense]|nr:Crp/Fnr family transcriptional regulator [Caenispirillum bisanense]MCA1974271.1 Crp/Fnr family transcriptional regulator [Caenispirillum sp.]